MERIRVAVNGYGTLGKRVADAVRLQPDMDLVGVCDVASNYHIKVAAALGLPIYAAAGAKEAEMKAAGIACLGSLDYLLSLVDVVVDCTPRGVGRLNLDHYQRAAVKAVFQGREEHTVAGHTFVATANYATAVGREYTRVASPHTISMARSLTALAEAGLLGKARGVIMRHPEDGSWLPNNPRPLPGDLPTTDRRSRQTDELLAVLPELDAVTFVARSNRPQDHSHYWIVEMPRLADAADVLAAFRAAPRLALVKMSDGLHDFEDLHALMLDLGRPRGDMWETAIWEDSVNIQRTELYFSYQVSNEATAVPDNMDAIRALTATERFAPESIQRTDHALGLRRDFVSWVRHT